MRMTIKVNPERGKDINIERNDENRFWIELYYPWPSIFFQILQFPASCSTLSSSAPWATTSSPWSITELDAPNQPPANTIPKMNLNGRHLSFTDSRYQNFPWIGYRP